HVAVVVIGVLRIGGLVALGAAALGIFLDALGEGHARGGVALRAVAAAVDGEVLELDLTGPAAGQGVVSLPAAGLAALWEIERADALELIRYQLTGERVEQRDVAVFERAAERVVGDHGHVAA